MKKIKWRIALTVILLYWFVSSIYFVGHTSGCEPFSVYLPIKILITLGSVAMLGWMSARETCTK